MHDHDTQTGTEHNHGGPGGLHPSKDPGVRFREAPIASFDDLTRGLLWPTLFRAPALALRPERVGLAAACLVVVGLIGSLATLWSDRGGLGEAVAGALGGGVERTIAALLAGNVTQMIEDGVLTWAGLYEVFRNRPVTGVVLGVPMLLALGVGVGAIGRSAAREFADGVREPWPRSLGFGLSRAPSFFFALAGPVLVVALVALLIAVSGWVLLTLPGLNVLGALLFGVTLLLGLFAAIALVFGALAIPISGAALACEGTDAIDALQRAYAYAVARPIRLLLYILLAKVIGLGFLALVGGVVGLGAFFTVHASEWFGGRALVPDAQGLWAVSTGIVGFWLGLLELLLAAVGMSYSVCAATLVYLHIRRVVDGQDPRDLWSPPGGSDLG